MNQVVNGDSNRDRGPDGGCEVGNERFFGFCEETKKRKNYLFKKELIGFNFSV